MYNLFYNIYGLLKGSKIESFESNEKSFENLKKRKQNTKEKCYFILIEYEISINSLQKSFSQNLKNFLLTQLTTYKVEEEEAYLGFRVRLYKNNENVKFFVLHFSAESEKTLRKNIKNNNLENLKEIWAYKNLGSIEKPIKFKVENEVIVEETKEEEKKEEKKFIN